MSKFSVSDNTIDCVDINNRVNELTKMVNDFTLQEFLQCRVKIYEKELEHYQEIHAQVSSEHNYLAAEVVQSCIVSTSRARDVTLAFLQVLQNTYDELNMLTLVVVEGRSLTSEWDKERLINDRHLLTYVKELAVYLKPMDTDSWPYCHINWEAAAAAFKNDYTEMCIDGNLFFIRTE